MLLHILLAAEILSTILCIHCIYGKSFRLDDKTAETFLSILIILEIINREDLHGAYSLLVYMILFIYCKVKFKETVMETLTSLIICTVLVTAVQFMCLLFANMLLIEAEAARDAVGNILLLAVFALLLSTNGLYRMKKSLCLHSNFIIIALGFMCMTMMAILLEGKVFREIHMQYFIVAVPAIVLLLYLVLKWYTARNETEKMREKLWETEESRKGYEDLLIRVRLRQHALKNHLEAIFSAHYTYKTYEKLVQVQEEYCAKLLSENKYNGLLLMENDVLSGFLWKKIQEAEADGIEIDYKITSGMGKCQVPTYYIIEMLGILFDNAMEALKSADEKEIAFEVYEVDGKYEVMIRNPFPYVPYHDILEWFRIEKSKKGYGRGLGLYHLKSLCEEWNCDIGCGNKEIDQKNWIVFCLKIGKADSI